MRPSTRLLKHVPLIRFVGGPHVVTSNISTAPKVHPMAPNGELPGSRSTVKSTYFNSNPIEPKEGEFFSRSQLSERFRYKAPKASEMENVESGGAELVF